MTFVKILLCTTFLFVYLSASKALKCRTELNDRQNEGFFDIARACAQNSGTTSGGSGGANSGGSGGMGGNGGGGGSQQRPWSQQSHQDSNRGQNGGNGGHRQNNQYGNQNNDQKYCTSNYQNQERERDRPRFSSSGAGSGGGSSNNDDDKYFNKNENNYYDKNRFREGNGQYRVKVQYGSDNGRPYPRGKRATKIITNLRQNNESKTSTTPGETGKSSLLEEMDAVSTFNVTGNN